MNTGTRLTVVILASAAHLAAVPALADGIVVDKIYHPYVEPLAQELEWRTVYQDHQPGMDDHRQLQRLAYGRAFGERWFGEMYLVGDSSSQEALDLEAIEIEAITQLTEQGEYAADWGLLFELEQEMDEDIWEAGVGLLVEKEIGTWSLAANLVISQEWGRHIDDELESRLGVQARYRLARGFEPALEFHSGEDTRALGPVIMGNMDAGIRRSIHWELGWLFGVDDDSPNQTFRAGLEYEF